LTQAEVLIMVRKMMEIPGIRFSLDAVVGAAVFLGLMVATLGPSAAAQILAGAEVPAAALPFATVSGLGDVQGMLAVLTVVFSALFALNLAFVRHIQRTNAPVKVRVEQPRSDLGA
jgi:hypothetical protein